MFGKLESGQNGRECHFQIDQYLEPSRVLSVSTGNVRNNLIQPIKELALDIGFASRLDRIQRLGAFLTAQGFKLFNGCGFSQIVPEHCDVDIFRKPTDQPKPL